MAALKNPQWEAFARHCASGKSKRESAVLAGYSSQSASNLGTKLAKKAKIQERISELQAKVEQKTVQSCVRLVDLEISAKANRIQAQDQRWSKLKQIADERAQEFATHPKLQNVPGGRTGFIVRQLKALGTGPMMRVVPEYVFDAALFKAFQSQEEQTAKELGQLVEKKDVKLDVKNLSDEDLEALADSIPDDLTAESFAGSED